MREPEDHFYRPEEMSLEQYCRGLAMFTIDGKGHGKEFLLDWPGGLTWQWELWRRICEGMRRYGDEVLRRQRDEADHLRWERDLLALNVRKLPSPIKIELGANGEVSRVVVLEHNATDDLVIFPEDRKRRR